QRARILTNDELQAVWVAAADDAGAFGAMVQFILLTSARRDEAAKLSRSEIVGADWTLPAIRNKAEVDLIRPLSAATLKLLAGVPRFQGCRYVFTNDGVHAVGGYGKFKAALDKVVLKELRAVAMQRNDQELLAYVVQVEDIMTRMAAAKG